MAGSGREGDGRGGGLPGSYVSAGIFALLLLLAGFMTGWLLSGGQPQFLGSEEPSETSQESVAGDPVGGALARETLPEADVSGSDIPDIPRYPESVMIEYKQEVYRSDIMMTGIDYVTQDEPEAVRDFYRNVFREEEWTVADISFSRGEWEFFVVKGEKEATVEIEPENGLTEIDIELTRPLEEPEGSREGSQEVPAETPAETSTEESTAPPEPAPEPQAPAPAPAPAPPPVPYDDDDGGYDFDDDGDFDD